MKCARKALIRSIGRIFYTPIFPGETSILKLDFGGEYKTILFSTIAHFSHYQQWYQAAGFSPFLSTTFEYFAKLSNSHDDKESKAAQKQYRNWEKKDPPWSWRVISLRIKSERIIEWLAKFLWRITQFYKEFESNSEAK